MGMYSFFEDEDIEVNDWEGLKLFFKEWENYQKSIPENERLYYATKEKMIKKNDDNKEYLTFKEWNDIKLISYWYSETLIFLTMIAKYIEDGGRVDWEFENKDETGNIEFENGECNVITGVTNYTEWSSDKEINLDKLPIKLKKILILNNLK